MDSGPGSSTDAEDLESGEELKTAFREYLGTEFDVTEAEAANIADQIENVLDELVGVESRRAEADYDIAKNLENNYPMLSALVNSRPDETVLPNWMQQAIDGDDVVQSLLSRKRSVETSSRQPRTNRPGEPREVNKLAHYLSRKLGLIRLQAAVRIYLRSIVGYTGTPDFFEAAAS